MTNEEYLLPQTTGIYLGATEGAETVWGSGDVFNASNNQDLRAWNLELPGKPTPEMLVDISKLVADGNFAEVYGSLGVDLNMLRIPQAKIVLFSRNHSDLLDPHRYGAFFLFTRADEPVNEDKSNLFVAYVFPLENGRVLRADVYEFSHKNIWRARWEYSFVLPQHKT